jgi:hypothetical protein
MYHEMEDEILHNDGVTETREAVLTKTERDK